MSTFAEKCVWSYSWDVIDDLSALSEDTIIDYLLDRLQQGKIYTWVGTLLLATNPSGEISTDLSRLYDLSRIDKYVNICDVTHKEVAPHIFAVAARAHYRIIQGVGKPSQLIVLNGETGTGKTFNARKALEFLTASTKNVSADIRKRDIVCDIAQKITDACRLISAFTTAPTKRNEVSSRHVQLIWLEYKKGDICGAKVSSYLLERDRVTMGCYNFQIFSQMMTALADVEFADTGLSKDEQYHMLSDLNSKEQQHYDNFQAILKALDMLGFTRDQRKNIFQVLSLLIHMSNIRFVKEDDHCKIDTDSKQSKEALENTCKLTCLKKENIVELLTSILINPQSSWRRRSMYRRNLNTDDACRRLHSIIRHLYDLLFHWLIDSVNKILSVRSSENNERLGILDIFGFEYFNENGIEQLCINYVNERLQQYFVINYLESYRKNLQEEGLIDNEQSLEIVQSYEDRLYTIEKQLFAIINDVCQSTVPSNPSTLIRQIRANSHPVTKRFLNIRNENFIIQHYANAVEYSVNDLLSKNTDKIPDEIVITFSASGNNFLYSLINENKSYHDGKLHVKKLTMLSKLRYNMHLLIQELNKCDTHYIRCIKPRRLDNHNWDRYELHKQLANTGVLDTLPLARCKYPIYFTYQEFSNRYCKKHTVSYDLSIACKKMLESSYLTTMHDNSSVHYGKRLIFLTKSIFLQLEFARRQQHIEYVKKLESFWIKYRRKKVRASGEYIKNMQQSKIEEMYATIDFNIVRTDISVPSQEDNDGTGEVSYYDRDDQTNNLFIAGKSLSKAKNYQQNMERNTDVGVVVNANSENRSITQKQDQPMQSTSNIGECQSKTAFITHWLRNMIEITNINKNTEFLIPEQLNHDYNQFTDINCNNNTRSQCMHMCSNNGLLHMQNRHEKKSTDCNKEEDVYVIKHDTSTFFYRNRILSRRRLANVPIRIHTHLTCLTNSHYLIYTQLPQGLQDCL